MSRSRKMCCFVALLLFPPGALNPPVSDLSDASRYFHGMKLVNFADHTIKAAPADPEKNACVAEPGFRVSVCKDVDAKEFPGTNVIRPTYSRWGTDNSDGTMYYVVKNSETPTGSGKGQLVILRSADNSVVTIPNLNGQEASEFRWDGSGRFPKRMYYVSDCSLYQYDVGTATSTLVRDFSTWVKQRFGESCGKIFNDVEGDSSPDSRYWAFMITKPYQFGTFPLTAVIVYDKQSDSIVGVFDREKFVAQGGNPWLWETRGFRPNMVDIAPSGDRVLLLWPCNRYPVNDEIEPASPAYVYQGFAALTSNTPLSDFGRGSKVILSDSSEARLNGTWDVVQVQDAHTLIIDIRASGLPNGTYKSSSFRPALLSVDVSRGRVLVRSSVEHHLEAGTAITLSGIADPGLNNEFTVTDIPNARAFVVKADVPDGHYEAKGMYYRDSRYGSCIPDTASTAQTRSADISSDGPHVYTFDFSQFVRVCNNETHGGWAWDQAGKPVYVCQVDHGNWSRAPADTIGFTDIYSGKYTPIMFHSDLSYEGGFHFGRFYNRNIRGWAMMTVAADQNDSNKLRDSLVFLELKDYQDHPRIWRAAQLFNLHVDYDTEAHGYLTRDGQTFRYGGNWNGKRPVSTYSIKLPKSWWTSYKSKPSSSN